ncbi:GtrA family protein [Patescibacteria group bacterium]
MKKDYLIAVIAGFVTALFALPLLKNIQIGGAGLKFALPIIIPILWIIGLWLGKFLARWMSVMYQFAKFVVVGFLNTAIDFGVLNLLSIMTGLTGGFLIGGVNIPGFTLASLNSYFWNKFWVFRAGEKSFSDFFTFAIVVLIGVFINGGIVIFVTTYVNPLFGLSPERWLNIAKAGATAISLIWNFIGFKFIVFKK